MSGSIPGMAPTLIANDKRCSATEGAFALDPAEPNGKIVYDL